MNLPRLALGGWQLGGHGWGKTSDQDMITAVRRALQMGITFFDTAPIYGLGHSEEILGKALGALRRDVTIGTKVGLVWEEAGAFKKSTDNSPKNIIREIDMSLQRLGTDYVDLYQIHWPDSTRPIEDTIRVMEDLKRAGKIRAIGCCNFSVELLKEAAKYGEIESVQVPYNLIDRSYEATLFPYCLENGVKVLAYSPLARGLLTGKYESTTRFEPDDHRGRDGDQYFDGPSFAKNLKIAERVKAVAARLNLTPAQVALRWVLGSRWAPTAIFGAKNAEQVEENVLASGCALPEADLKFLGEEIDA